MADVEEPAVHRHDRLSGHLTAALRARLPLPWLLGHGQPLVHVDGDVFDEQDRDAEDGEDQQRKVQRVAWHGCLLVDGADVDDVAVGAFVSGVVFAEEHQPGGPGEVGLVAGFEGAG